MCIDLFVILCKKNLKIYLFVFLFIEIKIYLYKKIFDENVYDMMV